jgi:3-dehydro-L-gulonate 2-dehydrogenase
MKRSYEQIKEELARVLVKYGMEPDSADQSARLFADNTLDGVASHGVNRFPRVISYIEKGYINVAARPTLVSSSGALEKWDGNLGMGNLNARHCMNRAIELAGTYGIGLVALRNTNHWMRGGAYGWQAANAGYVGMCWTNTQPNMPAWGAKDRRIGNNPFVIALPRKEGHVVLDAAMAQYSYGKIEETAYAGNQLPFPGGYDDAGNLTTDPAAIKKTWRVLPIGFWKGSGFSIVLDMLASVLAEGNSTYEVGKLGDDEYALSQVLIAIDIRKSTDAEYAENMMNETIADIKASVPVSEQERIMYPGERAMMTRRKNIANGIEIDDAVWKTITSL